MTGAARASATALFLARVFQKLLLNFTWWVNRKDADGQEHLLAAASSASTTSACSTARSRCPPAATWSRPTAPPGWRSTAPPCCRWRWSWRSDDPAYEDMASKFFEHFVAHRRRHEHRSAAPACGTRRTASTTTSSTSTARAMPLRVRSMVGLIPLFAVEVLEDDVIDQLPGVQEAHAAGSSRTASDLAGQVTLRARATRHGHRAARHPVARAPGARAALPARRERVPLAVRHPLAVARAPATRPTCSCIDGAGVPRRLRARASRPRGLFGGNSNWRGPVWFPVNYLLIEALERYHHFYGDRLQVECPTGSGRRADPAAGGATSWRGGWRALFLPGRRRRAAPATAATRATPDDPHWRDLLLFHEYFHGDTGRGARRQPPDRLDRAGDPLPGGLRPAKMRCDAWRGRSLKRACKPSRPLPWNSATPPWLR